jgi:coenzyme F420-0:L-glutamate ligase/coenzyme F420-1:gamma-L-glutamate ligase
MKKIEVMGLQTLSEIKEGDNLAEIIVSSSQDEIGKLMENDIIVLTSKIVSKAAGLTRKLDEVKPGRKAIFISRKTGKDAKWIQMIFDAGHKILAIMPLTGVIERQILGASEDSVSAEQLIQHEKVICITRDKNGRIYTCDAGIDGSNHPEGIVSLLPNDPDKSAKDIREGIQKLIGKKIAVIIADTEIVPFGTMDLAIGSSGIRPRTRMFGKKDLFDKPKFGGMDIVAHELTAACALVFGQVDAGIPAAVIRGYEYEIDENENIANTIQPQLSKSDVSDTVKAAVRVTSYAYSLKKQLILKIVSWLMK